MRRIASVTFIASILFAGGCEREQPAPAPMEPAQTVPPTLQIRPIAPLAPARRTHIAVDPRGNVFWSQEEDGGEDVVFSIGDDGVPRATGLTAASALAATGEAAGEAASGNIQSLAFGPDGALYFYLSGGTRRRTIAALGRYIPASSKIELIAPTAALMSAADMGRSLALARGTLVASGNRLVLWLRHTDQSLMFEIDPRGAGTLRRAPDVRFAAGAVNLRRENQFLASGGDGSLLLLDLSSAQLLSIDPAGNARELLHLGGLPRALSRPAADADGTVRFVAGDGATIPANSQTQADRSAIQFPALFTLEGSQLEAIPRTDITTHSGFRLGGMKIQLLVADRSGGYIAYDDASGELLRLRMEGHINR